MLLPVEIQPLTSKLGGMRRRSIKHVVQQRQSVNNGVNVIAEE